MRQLEARSIPRGAAIVIDRKGYVAGWNEGAEVVLGFAAREVIGRACHHVLCGRDPQGRLVCHPWCPLSPKAESADYEDEVVMYSRSASRDVVCLTLSVLSVNGADGTPGWVVHEITSADVLLTGPMTAEDDDLPRVPRRTPRRRAPKQH
jgi:PAS domain-containing protein